MKRVGRPMKYGAYIDALDDDEVYSPASIVDNGISHGIFPKGLQKDQAKQERMRIRHALARFADNHAFPDEQDGLVRLRGQAKTPGWFGWRWKHAADSGNHGNRLK